MNSLLTACRNSFFAIAELHRLGFNRMRGMPYFENRQWILLLGDESLFDFRFGAYVSLQRRSECILLQPTIQSGYADVQQKEPWEIAQGLVKRLPRKFEFRTIGPTAYSLWFMSLVAYMAIHPRALPWVSANEDFQTVWVNSVSPEAKTTLQQSVKFKDPPSGTFDQNVAPVIDPEVAVAQPRPIGAPSLIWPTTKSSDSRLENWYENNARGDPREVQ